MITNYNNFLNESIIENINTFAIEVNDIDDINRVKYLFETIKDINFSYNTYIDEIIYFPNWLIIELDPNTNKDIYITFWTSESDPERFRNRVEKFVKSREDHDKHIYTMDELPILLNKIRRRFGIVPDYSPRKIIRENNNKS
jgi:hypothetical protein